MKLTNFLRDAFVRQVMADVPGVDYDEKTRIAAMKLAVAALPPKVRAIWNDLELRDYVMTTRQFAGSVHMALPGRLLSADAQAKLEVLEEARMEQFQRNNALRDKLKAVAYSATTRKALADMLPEFEKYLPADDAAACRTVPAIANVVADFAAAGWPKGKKPERVAA